MRADDDLELFLIDLKELCIKYKFSVVIKIQEIVSDNYELAGFYVSEEDSTILLPAYIKKDEK